jgi:vitamin B12 transporter
MHHFGAAQLSCSSLLQRIFAAYTFLLRFLHAAPRLGGNYNAPSEGERRTTMKAVRYGRVLATLLFFLLSCSNPAWILAAAQSKSLTAVVRDRTGGRIPQAHLRVFESSSASALQLSATDGQFDLSNLQPGSYLIEISADGFQTLSKRLTWPPSDEPLEWVLDVAGTHQNINVLASDLASLPDEEAKSVSIVDSEELRARDVVTLGDALRSVPGLQLQQLGGPSGLSSIRFRGLRPEDAAIQMDSFRFTDPSDNKGSPRSLLTEFSVAGVGRLEILRGAASSLYGTHAIGGVVNAMTQYPTKPLGGYISMQGGSMGLLLPSAGVAGWIDSQRLAYALDLTHQNYLSGLDGQDASRNTSGTAATWLDLHSRARLFTRFSMSDSFAYLNESPSPALDLPELPSGVLVRDAVSFPDSQGNFYPQLNDPDNHQHIRFFAGAMKLDLDGASIWHQTVGFQAMRARRRYDDGPNLDPLAATLGYPESSTTRLSRYDSSNDQLYWRNAVAITGTDTMHLGAEFSRTAIDQLEFGQTTVATQKALAIQASNILRLADGRLRLQFGGQAEFYLLNTPEFLAPEGTSNPSPYTEVGKLDAPSAYTADISLAYQLRPGSTKLRAHAGNGFRSPSLYERYGSGGRGFYYGNPLVKPERTNFIDAGVDQKFWGERAEAGATWYYSRLHTIIDFGSTPADQFGRFFGYVNTRGGSARGVEILLKARPHRMFSLSTGYTYANSDLPFATAAGTTRVFGVSDHQLNAGLLVTPAHRLRVHLQTYAVSSHDFPLFGSAFPFPSGVYRFSGYTLLDLTTSADLISNERQTLRFTFRADNLLNQEYFNAGFREPKTNFCTGLRWEF